MSVGPRELVVGFCDAFERRDVEDVLAYMAAEIVYQNVSLPAMHGIEEAATFLTPLLRNTTKIEFKILSIAVSSSGNEVLTERLDRLHFSTGVVDIPLMGIFVVRQGKIVEWRDYSDINAAMEQFTRAKIDLTKPDYGLVR